MAYTNVQYTVLMDKSGIQANFGTAAGLLGFVSILAQIRYMTVAMLSSPLPLKQPNVFRLTAFFHIDHATLYYKWKKRETFKEVE